MGRAVLTPPVRRAGRVPKSVAVQSCGFSIARCAGWAANLVGVERSEAEAIYDSGREACVEFLMGLMDRQLRLEERLRALEQKASASSRNSSSPPSHGRSEDSSAASSGGAGESQGVGPRGRRSSARRAVSPVTRALGGSCYPRTGCWRSLTITQRSARGAGGSSPPVRRFRVTGRDVIRLPSCHRPRSCTPSIAPTGCGARGCAKRTRATLGVVGESAFGPGLAGRGRGVDGTEPDLAAGHERVALGAVRGAGLGRRDRRDLSAHHAGCSPPRTSVWRAGCWAPWRSTSMRPAGISPARTARCGRPRPRRRRSSGSSRTATATDWSSCSVPTFKES